jgi:hypothetical protein
MALINKTNFMLSVPIVLADGTRDSVNIQPNRRVNLPEGAILDPRRARDFSTQITDTDAAKNAHAVQAATSHAMPKPGTTASSAAAAPAATPSPSSGVRATVTVGTTSVETDAQPKK